MPNNFVHYSEIAPRPGFLKSWERHRHRKAHWFVQCVAEAFGVFLYCYAGASVTAAWVLGNIAELPSVGSLLTIGFGYAMGIVLAITLCSSTSGGHFNPCVTIAQWLLRGFPARKVPMFILAQILGAYIATGLIYVQYRHLIVPIEAALKLKGVYDAVQFTPNGPAGVFALYVAPGTPLGYVFVNEFVVDFVLGVTIWACLDPTNMLLHPASVPWVIGMAYAMAIWGFAPVGLAANSARDIGGRLMALTIWGGDAGGGSYAALAALTNIPATLAGALFYEFFLADSARVLNPAQHTFILAHQAHADEVGVRHHGLQRPASNGSMAKREANHIEGV